MGFPWSLSSQLGRTWLHCFAAVALLATSCTGAIEPDGPGSVGQNGGIGGSGTAAGGRGGNPLGGTAGLPLVDMPVPGQPVNDGIAGQLRRLTTEEYRNTVVDLLGLASFNLGPINAFLPDGRSGLFLNNLDLPAGNAITANYMLAAESFADERVRYNFATLSTCQFGRTEELCAREFISRMGKRTFRRPLQDVEVEEFFTLFQDIRTTTGGTYLDGVRVVLSTLLQSHEFLYHFEVGDPTRATDGKTPLTDYEIASRLSFMFWSSMPDPELFAAADKGELRTAAGLAAQVERILALPRTRGGILRFFREWLNYRDSIEIYNNPLYGAARPFIDREVDRFIESVIFDGDGRMGTLLTAPYSFINAPLAAIYGIAGVTGDALVRHPLDPKKRAGFLTMPIFMANTAFADGTIRPVIRGQYIRQRLLCQELPPPPPEANTMAPKISGSASIRQRYSQHAKDSFCSSCHQFMDPIGLVFDRYQATGAFRAIDPVNPGPDGDDDEGELIGTDVDGLVKGVPDLAARLAQSADVRSCVSKQWFRYALGRSGENAKDEVALEQLTAVVNKGGGDLRLLWRGLTESDAFRFVDVPKIGVCQ